MSYSSCISCSSMVSMYEKYCDDCMKTNCVGFKQDKDWHNKVLQSGTKLIFYQDGGVLSTKKGNVFTFANWVDAPGEQPNKYWQCQELLDMGNKAHSFSIHDVDIFDPKIHKGYIIMTRLILIGNKQEFIREYGS